MRAGHDTERVLFAGRLGTQSVRVWLDASAPGIRLLSHDSSPGLESYFGKDDLETFLEVDASHVLAIAAILRAERTDADAPTDVLDLLADKYRRNSAATSAFCDLLVAHGIPHRFAVV